MKQTFIIGLVLGLCGGAYATVACGSFDRTDLEITKMEKDGVAVALPTVVRTEIGSDGYASYLYDPSVDRYVEVNLERQP